MPHFQLSLCNKASRLATAASSILFFFPACIFTFLIFLPIAQAAPGGSLTPKAVSASTTWVIPSASNSSGAYGAYFKTHLILFNPTTLSYNVNASLYNELGPVRTVVLPVTSLQNASWDDFLGTVFNYTGAGTLILDSSTGGNTSAVFLVTAEVYSDSTSGGRYKTVVASGSAIDPISSSNPAYNIGISVNSTTRTNIGCFNTQTISVTVAADILNSDGTVLQTINLTLPPRSWTQVSLTTTVDNGIVAWHPNGTIYAYAVVVDNTSNDGSYFVAAEYTSDNGGGGGGGRG
jgi:hypothetical protein